MSLVREIVLDTETTGLDPDQGHRIVEVAAVELVNHIPTGKRFHVYVNPERDMPDEAFRVHGLSAEFLAEHPAFALLVDELVDFVGDSRVVIHNAAFDMRFLNAELKKAGREPWHPSKALCTLILAQRRFPGSPASLDALCKRFGVDNSARQLHGALLDCQLLAEVYLHLLGGRQTDLGLATPRSAASIAGLAARIPRAPRPHAPSEEELAAHAAFVRLLDNPLWDM